LNFSATYAMAGLGPIALTLVFLATALLLAYLV
jgi:hypothetical protein